MDRLLGEYRVIDLTDEKGFLCGRILGDLGAEVIVVEPPSGHPCRRIGPFYKDIPHPERSLYWFAYGMNKKGITLDLETEDGRAILRDLAGKSDILVESFDRGYLEGRGLGYEDLKRANPKLIVTSIRSFGEKGPYRDYKGSDLVHWSLGGIQHLSGDPDLPPVRISFPQSYLHSGAQAAIGTLMALYSREAHGEGEHVQVSVHDCIPIITMDAPAYWDLLRFDLQRGGSVRRRLMPGGLLLVRGVFPCKDGYVVNYILGGGLGEAGNRQLSEWMESEGIDLEPLRETGWPSVDMAKITPEQMSMINDTIGAFLLRHTKEELYEGVFARGADIMLVPVSSAKDLRENRQLKERGFWVEVEHPELDGRITYPGPWAVVEDGPSLTGWKRAPLIGENNEEVFEGILGLSKEELGRLKQAGVI